jgi:hypothetical protein
VRIPTLAGSRPHANGRADGSAAEPADGSPDAADRIAGLAWRALAVIRLVNGLLALVAPQFLARRLGFSAVAVSATNTALAIVAARRSGGS